MPPIAHAEALEDFQYVSLPTSAGPAGVVRNMAQDNDGFLWIAGDRGLVRFDGVSFVPFSALTDEPFDRAQFEGVFAAEDGGVWLDRSGNGPSRARDGKLKSYGKDEGYVGAGALFYRAPSGHVRSMSSEGINEFSDDRWHFILPLKDGYQAAFDSEGHEWIIAEDQLFVRETADGPLVRPSGAPVGPWGMRFGPSGRAYFTEKDAVRIFRRNGIALTEITQPIAFGTSSLIESQSGAVWMIGRDAVMLLSDAALKQAERDHATPSMEAFTAANGLADAGLYKLLEDRDGNIWVGSSTALGLFRRTAFTEVKLPEPLSHLVSASDSHGNLWVGSGAHPVFRRDASGAWKTLESAERAVAMTRDPVRDVAWALAQRALWKLSDAGDVVAAPFPYPEWDAENDCLVADGRGNVVVCPLGAYRSNVGLAPKVWDGSRWNELPMLPGRASTGAFDAQGVLWFGLSNANGVARLRGGEFEIIGPEQGMTVGPIRALTPDAGGLWLGGDRGVQYFDGTRFLSLTADGRWPIDSASGVVVDEAGFLWIHNLDGVLRSHEPNVAARLRTEQSPQQFDHFGPSDGIRGVANVDRAMPSLRLGGDGRLWVQTLSALSSIDPANMPSPLPPNGPRIDAVEVQGHLRVPRNGVVALGSDQRDLRVAYDTATLAHPDPVRFAYRLVGLEEAWTDAGARREATFTNIPPGQFQFEVKALQDGGLSSSVATLRIDRSPAFHETWWFRMLLLVPLLALVWLAYIARTRAISRRVKIRAEEREAVARDIHDTLLQRIQGVMLTMQAWSVDDEIPDAKRAEMLEMSEQTRGVLIEGRERIAALRNSQDRGLRVYDALLKEGSQLARVHGAVFGINVAGSPRPLRAEAEAELQAATLEAVRNAFSHARGTRVTVDIVYEEDALWIVVSDDGQGIDEQALSAAPSQGHFGMVGLRERVDRLKGTLRIDSAPAEGTEIHVRVPARTAYA
ncbi:MAG: ATP-binding protein [Rhodanobacteraceae bacterium]